MEFRNKKILILGGNSDLGKSLATKFAGLGCNLIITERSEGQLKNLSLMLKNKFNITCEVCFFDAIKINTHLNFYKNLAFQPDIVISCIGHLDNQNISERNFDEALKSIYTNYIGLVSIFNIIAEDFSEKMGGVIIGVSSVAGERGRKSNFIYGSSKSAFTVYLSGLRNKLKENRVNVITVIPGFIKSKMTAHLKLPKFVTATPEEVANDIIKSIKNKKHIVYSKWFWKYIILIIKLIPERIFIKTSI